MVFNGKKLNINTMIVNIVLGIVGVTLLGALLPTAIETLINMTNDIFTGTIFAPVFSNGLVVYGIVTVGIIALIFKLFGVGKGR